MKTINFIILLLLVCLPLSLLAADSPAKSSQASAINSIAQILIGLNHQPSKEQKQSLQQIIDDQAVSGNTRNLAAVLAKINHKPAKADKMLLDMVVSDKNATAKEQNIAKILRNLDHQASNEEKQTLQQMVMTEE